MNELNKLCTTAAYFESVVLPSVWAEAETYMENAFTDKMGDMLSAATNACAEFVKNLIARLKDFFAKVKLQIREMRKQKDKDYLDKLRNDHVYRTSLNEIIKKHQRYIKEMARILDAYVSKRMPDNVAVTRANMITEDMLTYVNTMLSRLPGLSPFDIAILLEDTYTVMESTTVAFEEKVSKYLEKRRISEDQKNVILQLAQFPASFAVSMVKRSSATGDLI